MMKFLRKHQKIFYYVITTVIVITFSFFGTYSTIEKRVKKGDAVSFIAVDGSKILESELKLFTHFLSSDLDTKTMQKGMPNLLNDGIIRKDFLATKIANILVKNSFDTVKDDLSAKVQHMKDYHFYRHSSLPLSEKNLWKENCKTALFDVLEKTEAPSLAFFDTLSSFYLDQVVVHPELIRRTILSDLKRFHYQEMDPQLTERDFTLFGFHTVEEWFGPGFIDLSARFLINTSIIAEQKGYGVSDEEALYSLRKNLNELLKKNMGLERLILQTKEDPLSFSLHVLGFDQKEGIIVWKRVLAFRNYFQDAANALFLDPLTFSEYGKFAKQEAKINLYELPSYLHLKDLQDLLRLQMYLKLTTPLFAKNEFLLELSDLYYPIEEIEAHAKELIKTRYVLDIKDIDLTELSLCITEKELLSWELDHYTSFSSRYRLPLEKDRQKCFGALEALSFQERIKLDKECRNKILKEHPERVKEELERRSFKNRIVFFRESGTFSPLKGIGNSKKLSALLQKEKSLSCYTEDNQIYYSIKVKELPKEKELLTYEESLSEGTIDLLLDRYLKEQGEGSKEEKAKKGFSELFTALDTHFAKEKAPLDYPSLRLRAYVQKCRTLIQSASNDTPFIRMGTTTLENQWKLIKEEKTVKREKKPDPFQDLFTSKKNLSDIYHDSGNLFFYVVKERLQSSDISEEVGLAKEVLSASVKRELAKELLRSFQKGEK